jgi:hypothetical protein
MSRYFEWLARISSGEVTKGEPQAQHDFVGGSGVCCLATSSAPSVAQTTQASPATQGNGSDDRRPDAGNQPAAPGTD